MNSSTNANTPASALAIVEKYSDASTMVSKKNPQQQAEGKFEGAFTFLFIRSDSYGIRKKWKEQATPNIGWFRNYRQSSSLWCKR